MQGTYLLTCAKPSVDFVSYEIDVDEVLVEALHLRFQSFFQDVQIEGNFCAVPLDDQFSCWLHLSQVDSVILLQVERLGAAD